MLGSAHGKHPRRLKPLQNGVKRGLRQLHKGLQVLQYFVSVGLCALDCLKHADIIKSLFKLIIQAVGFSSLSVLLWSCFLCLYCFLLGLFYIACFFISFALCFLQSVFAPRFLRYASCQVFLRYAFLVPFFFAQRFLAVLRICRKKRKMNISQAVIPHISKYIISRCMAKIKDFAVNYLEKIKI